MKTYIVRHNRGGFPCKVIADDRYEARQKVANANNGNVDDYYIAKEF